MLRPGHSTMQHNEALEYNTKPTPDHMRNIDMQVALSIAGFAGVETRDRKGNIVADVWVRHTDKNTIGNLIDAADMKQLLLQQLQLHLTAQKDLLVEVEDEKVAVKWILKFTEMWEKRYRTSINRNFDISQKISAIMHDTLSIISTALKNSAINVDLLRTRCFEHAAREEDNTLPSEEAFVRFFFRNPFTGPVLCRLAGKYLQKRDVCNRAGNYSAKVQRHDITQERDDALRSALLFLQRDGRMLDNLEKLIASNDLVHWLVDHKQTAPPREEHEDKEGSSEESDTSE